MKYPNIPDWFLRCTPQIGNHKDGIMLDANYETTMNSTGKAWVSEETVTTFEQQWFNWEENAPGHKINRIFLATCLIDTPDEPAVYLCVRQGEAGSNKWMIIPDTISDSETTKLSTITVHTGEDMYWTHSNTPEYPEFPPQEDSDSE